MAPREEAQILGVVMDTERRYHKHLANAATKGLTAALALKRLRNISPSVARQLFGATVAPAMDYASSIWMYTGKGQIKAMEQAQRVGAQAIIGSF